MLSGLILELNAAQDRPRQQKDRKSEAPRAQMELHIQPAVRWKVVFGLGLTSL